MKCPVCKQPDLIMADRQGIEIDYCPTCRGIWLDRGELDKIIEKSITAVPPVPAEASRPARTDASYYEDRHHDDHDRHDSHHYGGRRKSWLSNIFD